MPPKIFLACCLLALTTTGCLMSDQIGEPVGRGRSQLPAKDMAIHFDTQFNVVVLFARSGALVGLALWVFSAWGPKPGSILVCLMLIATAGWLAITGYPTMTRYRLEVAPEGLTLRVPPDLDTLIPWESIETLTLEGFGYGRINSSPQYLLAGTLVTPTVPELPDWKTMGLTTSDGQSFTILLDALSIEHRQIFAKALIKAGDLVEE